MGDVVKADDLIADGPSDGSWVNWLLVVTCLWPLCRGMVITLKIVSLISERIVKDDVFTSIHIDEFEVMARDTKLGPEDITRDIPNVGEEGNFVILMRLVLFILVLKFILVIFLVGKITPKGESPMTPEEKLLRAIFGEKAADVRDTSMRLTPWCCGYCC